MPPSVIVSAFEEGIAIWRGVEPPTQTGAQSDRVVCGGGLGSERRKLMRGVDFYLRPKHFCRRFWVQDLVAHNRAQKGCVIVQRGLHGAGSAWFGMLLRAE